jgi:AraC-like DNA-binding protein
MKLDYLPPPPDLADYVSAFYLFEAELDELNDIERADVAQFRIVLAGSATVTFSDGRAQDFAGISLFGPRMGASKITARGPVMRMFGCGVLPAGWAVSIRRPAYQNINCVIPVDDVLSAVFPTLPAEIAACTTIEDMVAIAVGCCRSHFGSVDIKPVEFVRTVDAWLESSLVPSIADLVAKTGLSQRQIERLAKQYYGAPPKFLVRKYRALRAANQIANGNGDWQDFIDSDYYDQPHFIREIKEFIGMTPSAIRNANSPLSMLAFGRARLAGSVPPLVSAT